MTRSQISALMRDAEAFFAQHLFLLPLFARWTPGFHWSKSEDIINRGGENLVIELARATDDDALSDRELLVSCDGVARTVPSRGRIVREPGESVTLFREHTP